MSPFSFNLWVYYTSKLLACKQKNRIKLYQGFSIQFDTTRKFIPSNQALTAEAVHGEFYHRCLHQSPNYQVSPNHE